MKCPFCNAELRTNILDQPVIWYCPNHCIGSYEPKVWQALIDGKKAQRQLRTVKDRCVKKVKAKEREIHNCLYGIHVRDCEIETLQEKLSQAQDALKSIADDAFLYHPSISEKIPWEEHYYRLKDKAKSAITSITEQEARNETDNNI